MSRLQEAVDAFADAVLAETGQKASADCISDGTFSRWTAQGFCLCFRPLAVLIDFAGLDCSLCLKPVTEKTNEWYDEARSERRAAL